MAQEAVDKEATEASVDFLSDTFREIFEVGTIHSSTSHVFAYPCSKFLVIDFHSF